MEGESTRQLKVAKELQRVLAEIIRSQGMAAYDGALLTVSGVKISPDLAIARVYISCFPSSKSEAAIAQLESNTKAIRGTMGRQVAKQLRIIPELSFFLDNSLDYVEHIESLLK